MMKKIKINDVEEILYYEQLKNGLNVYMIPKKTVNNVYVTYTTKYGSIHNEFKSINSKKMIKVPNGIAHFLEHKMFEQENGVDPMIFFTSKGADVNAFTGLLNTTYLFYGSKHLNDNLKFLLDYVHSPYFTNENVEKEKGIIEQEINMYADIPYSELDDGIRKNLFHNHPAKYSIAGTINDVNDITKEQLYECYNTFYHPSNMFLVLTGNFNPEEVITIVKQKQEERCVPSVEKIETKKVKEPPTVIKEYEEKIMNVEIAKIAFSFKICLTDFQKERRKHDIYLLILFLVLFGQTSLFYEKMKENSYVDSEIDINYLHIDDYAILNLTSDTKKPKELINAIKEEIENINIDEKEFKRKKKVLISSMIHLFENIKTLNHHIIDSVNNYGNFNNDMLKLLRGLNIKEYREFIFKLNFNNYSSFVIKPKDKK